MPSGHYLKRLDRKRLLLAFCVFNRTAKQVFEEIYCGETSQITYRRLRYLRNKLLRADFNEKIGYVTKRKLRLNFRTNHPDGCYYSTMTFYWLKLLRLTMNWPINNWPFYSKERSGQLFHGFQEIKLLTRELDNNRRTKNSLGSIGSQTWMNKYRITKILLTLIQNVWWISMSHITVKENGNKCTGRVDFVQSRKNG